MGPVGMIPTSEELELARQTFLSNETRDLFYRAATYLVAQAVEGRSPLSLAEALAVLLQTWNASYYRYHPFNSAHFGAVEALLSSLQDRLNEMRRRSVLDAWSEDEVTETFEAFEQVLGPVGAAKALHLLCPKLFPLWDRTIAYTYGLGLGTAGTNGLRYCRFMAICRRQVAGLDPQLQEDENILKRLDELNYCRYTKGWI